MAAWDNAWLTGAATVTVCGHGTPSGAPCWYCQNPALGPAMQTFHLGGWSCPGCSRCYAPSVTQCPHCPPRAAIPSEDFTGGAEHDCAPPSEGGLCDHTDEPVQCTGGRHCSC